MIVLNNGDRIDINRTVGTAYMAVVINYRRVSGSVFEPKVALSEVGGSGTVQALVNSESGYTYLIENIWIRSHSGTATMNVNFTVSGTPQATLYLGTVKRNEAVHYDHKKGFKKVSRSGAVMKIGRGVMYPALIDNLEYAYATTSLANAAVTPNSLARFDNDTYEISGLTTGKYYFRCVLHYTAAATATGSRWTLLTYPNSTTTSIFTSEWSQTTTVRAINHGLTTEYEPAACNVSSASTAANIAIIEGFIDITTGNNSLWIYFASEVGSSAITARRGSTMEIIQVV